jgi:hypothetical protein
MLFFKATKCIKMYSIKEKAKKKLRADGMVSGKKKWCLMTLLAAGYSLSYLLCCGYSVGDAFL